MNHSEMDELDASASATRTEKRRLADQEAADYIATTLRWVQRGPRILVLLFGAMTGAAGTGAWVGSQASDVSQADLKQVNVRIDSLAKQLNQNQEAAVYVRDRQNEKLDLLLRLGCPTIKRADLIRECQIQGVTR